MKNWKRNWKRRTGWGVGETRCGERNGSGRTRAVRDELLGSHRKCSKVAFWSRGSVDEKSLLEERYILH